MKQLKKSKRPVVPTVEGGAEAVVQDAAAYQRLLDIAAQADAGEGIRQGLKESKRGAERDADEFLASTSGVANLVFRPAGGDSSPCKTAPTVARSRRRTATSGTCFTARSHRAVYRVLEKRQQVHVLHIRHGARQRFKTDDLRFKTDDLR
jgi:hypothetical protein